ncbi:EIN3-binding F-box protein 1-like [Lycium ferocissimum]|uniref:EIN3-binding F-box protein 1-like n=1 Tax=Lycium ferocissimum TaxID=112874 RepID=UPI0028153CAA|nr:EIN3-binding F-box protein 1-like [Lycium ferocissimum]XP_059299306.1 EIN3-binding F-box protein 1-like [Lycium ferocissimum]
MCKVIDYTGNGAFFPCGASYPKPKNSFSSIEKNVDVYFPSRKRIRVTAPFVATCESFEQKKQPSIEVLPDECLFEVFRRLSSGQERSACACVSKRWLTLLSSIRRDETFASKPNVSSESNGVEGEAETQDIEGEGYLTRCLDGKKATDVRLAAIAIGTASHGGLGKLSIRGNNPCRGVTDAGLKAVARGSPSLRDLSLWNVSSLGDEGLSEIAHGCHLLEKLDLCQCPAITDKSLLDIAKNCPNLTSLTIDSCSNIGNESLLAVGQYCPNLKVIAVKNCPLIGDQGIAGLFSSAGHALTKVKLQALNISDVSLAVIGHYGIAMTDLALGGLQSVNERGFWVMGNGQGLQKLKSLTISACNGVSDLGLEALCKGCPNLKLFCLQKCAVLLDNGLVAFVKASVSLENLQLEECHRITQAGFFGILLNCGKKLKALSLVNCFGVKDYTYACPLVAPCNSLQSLAIRNCPGVGNATVAIVGKLCPKLTHLELSGLLGITDEGLFPLVQSCLASLVEVNLSGCVNVTDKSVSAIAELHGGTLESLITDGCRQVTDATLLEISKSCWLLDELDVSKCGITDSGIATLAGAVQLSLRVLSLSGCHLVSDKSLPFLHELGQNLQGLNIQHCHGMSSITVDVLVEQLWRCDILS